MPRGAAVVRYEGARGVVWRVKYADSTGKQTMETLGREDDGWNRRRAERELGARLDRVRRERYRKPDAITFVAFAGRFRAEYLPGRNLKRSTLLDYEGTLDRHAIPFFGDMQLASIVAEDVDRFIAAKRTAGLSPKSVANMLILLGLLFKVARRWGLVTSNPVEDVDRPKVDTPEIQVLTEEEIAALLAAYRELEANPPADTTAAWWALTRRMVVVALGTGLRRGELLGLCWRDVSLVERRLTVRQAIVRGEVTSPKSKASRRTLELGPRVAAALEETWQASRYRADDSLVFCHPDLGTAIDPSKLARIYMRPALTTAGIVKPFRVWHDLRHTALTHEAAVNPAAYVQMRAGHAQGSITERYVHAAQIAFPGAAARSEARLFARDATGSSGRELGDERVDVGA